MVVDECHRYLAIYFKLAGLKNCNTDFNQVYGKFVSIMSDSHKFWLWYAQWVNEDMKGSKTHDYDYP